MMFSKSHQMLVYQCFADHEAIGRFGDCHVDGTGDGQPDDFERLKDVSAELILSADEQRSLNGYVEY